MIETMEGLPERVVGCRATGHVTDDDYKKVLIPAVEAALERHKKIGFLYQIGPGFEDFSAHAMWDDAVLGLSHISAFEKVAVVSDVDWLRRAVGLFRSLMPCPVKLFELTELEEAKAWVVERA